MRKQTLSDRIMTLHKRGMANNAIAEAVGVSANAVRSHISRCRVQESKAILNRPFGNKNTADFRRVSTLIDPDIDYKLEDAAAARRMTPAALCTILINTVLKDDLIAAVLDTEDAA